jgi:outer membrane protein TolC
MDLSFSDAVDKIMTESQDIKKADANLNRARANLDSVNANRWFTLTGTATYMNLVDVARPFHNQTVELPPALGGMIGMASGAKFSIPDNIFVAGAQLTQPIYTFGKIGNAVDAMRSAINMSESSLDLTRREVKYAAANIYWTAKMTDELVDIYQRSLDNARAAKKKLTAAGRASRANLVKIESDIATNEINLSDAKFNRETSFRMLKILAGIDVDTEIVLTDDFPKTFDEIKVSKLSSNPEWDIYEQQIKMYESNASSKRAGNAPTLAATAAYNYIAMNDDINVFGGTKAQSAYWGLALQWPIFDGGLSRANATAAAMDAVAARQDLDKSKKMKTEDFDNAIKKYNHLRANMSNWENARNLAQKAYNFSRDRFAAGQTSAVELSDVSNALSGVDMALLQAKYNIVMAAETVKKLGE